MSKRLWAAVAALVAMLSLAGIAGAGNVPRMGDQRVGLFECAFVPAGCSEITLAADEPFHVAHGWTSAISQQDLVDPALRVELSVDGTQKHGAIDFRFDPATGIWSKTYVFNFPQGMSGTHSFTGCWYLADGSPPFCGTRIVHFV
jgi:hypothetical protein